MKTKTGEEISTREFFSRWKKGIQDVTPLQQIKLSFIGVAMVLVGIIWGLIFSFVSKYYWLFVILLGSLFLSTTNLIGMLQKYFALKHVNEILKMKGGSYEQESTGV